MNVIQGRKPSGIKWNQLLDAYGTFLTYKKSTIDHSIYIILCSDETVSKLTLLTDDVINTTTNETEFNKLR